jgi:hypothetical protein
VKRRRWRAPRFSVPSVSRKISVHLANKRTPVRRPQTAKRAHLRRSREVGL